MEIRKLYELYTDLISNPFAAKTYKKLADHYKDLGLTQESEAFLHAITIKFNADDKHPDLQQ